MKIKGYKVTNPNYTCKRFKFKVGKTYIHKGEIEPCKSGFHFCINPADCFNYYEFRSKNKVFEIESLDKFITRGNKTVCNKIKIIRELTWQEVLVLVNTGEGNTGLSNSGKYNSGYRNLGHYNSGNCNSGHYNSGNCNSGHYNSGDCNSGNCNSGHYNSGHYNSGNCNSGYRNSGYRNSGRYNSGDHNSGDCNSGHYNSGLFNSDMPKLRIFNKPSKLDWNSKEILEVYDIISSYFYPNFNVWVYRKNMTEKEKKENPSYKTTGGYLKKADYKDCWVAMWKKLSKKQKKLFKKLPNFNKKIFKEITGIDY
jgi:hypothetical protein